MFSTFVQLVQAVIWPALIVFLLRQYGPEFRALFPRMKRASATGFEFEVAEQQRETEKLPTPTPSVTTTAQNADLSPAVTFVRSSIDGDLEKVAPEERQLKLVIALAETRLLFHFERSYRLILGSQIEGLKILNIRITATMKDAKLLYDRASELYPEIYDNFSFDVWIGFLEGQNFIENDGGVLRITEVGRDFLRYLIAQRMDERKPG
ncbi:hypothetical protein V5F59_05700 [Xanthobacter autotrophicus DSM 431]|uniref:hypothetical protein n=1 Tax=Xanthobacter nonsaccharivorans TaxID=3119912 RepID=UPI00372BFA54